MKTWILVSAILGLAAVKASADGQVDFKTSPPKDAVGYSLDGVTASPVPGTGPNPGVIPGYGTVSYEIYTATAGTALTLQPDGLPNFTGWNATAVGPVTYANDGTIVGEAVTLPGPPGGNVEMEVVAFTGSLTDLTLYGFSGMTFDGGNTVSYVISGNPVTDSTGALGWVNAILYPDTTPPEAPSGIVTGSAGFGSMVLEPVPESRLLFPFLGFVLVALQYLRRRFC